MSEKLSGLAKMGSVLELWSMRQKKSLLVEHLLDRYRHVRTVAEGDAGTGASVAGDGTSA